MALLQSLSSTLYLQTVASALNRLYYPKPKIYKPLISKLSARCDRKLHVSRPGVFIPSPSGRRRFNVLGALNAISKEVIIVTNESYINAQSICHLLLKLTALNLEVPITVVLDNARYQKCRVVFALAEALNIELLYLPSYSPHLNLIERLWKFVRNECLYSKYYADFDSFKDAIQTCLEQADTTHKKALKKLLSLNFQSFKNVHISSV